eukprot:sb/3467394/
MTVDIPLIYQQTARYTKHSLARQQRGAALEPPDPTTTTGPASSCHQDNTHQHQHLFSIPENSEPFFLSVTNSPPTSPPPPHGRAAAKYAASDIIPPSTKPSKVQVLQQRIKDAWEKRFTPRRVLDQLYVPGVLYATRARFTSDEEAFWKLSNQHHQGARNFSNDPLANPFGIDQLSVYLRRESAMSTNSTKKSWSLLEQVEKLKARQEGGIPARMQQQQQGSENSGLNSVDSILSMVRDEHAIKKRKSYRNPKKFQLPQGKTVQTFERRRTRPGDSMYDSLDPVVLNKSKLSKAFCDD